MQRRLRAILAADLAGYCRLMTLDDVGTLHRLRNRLDQVFTPEITRHGGSVFKAMGDGLLAQFPSAVAAVECAAAIQERVAQENLRAEADEPMLFRIGLHVGEVIEEDGDLFGDGVNIASRLQVVADPGQVCASRAIFDQVRRRVAFDFDDLGELSLRHIEDPMQAFTVVPVRSVKGGAAQPRPLAALDDDIVLVPRRPSIAILPFVDLGGSAAEECLADGLRLSVQSMLVQLSGLFLVNANVMNRFRDTDTTPAEAGKTLNVQYILSGSVQKIGRRVRAIMTLTDVARDEAIWSERADREEEDLFDMQDRFVDQVVTSLGIQLVEGAGFRIADKLPSPRARELFYRSVSHLYKFTAMDNYQARQLFAKLAEEFPETGFGIGNVALTHWLDSFNGWSVDDAGSRASAWDWGQRSISAGDVNGFGNTVCGNLELFDGHFDQAIELGRRAVSIRTSCPLSYGQLGQIEAYCGDPERAIKSTRYALHLERVFPPWLLNVLAIAYRDNGQHNMAVRVARACLDLAPNDQKSLLTLCSAQHLSGATHDARESAQRILRAHPMFTLSDHAAKEPYRDETMLQSVLDSLAAAGLPE